ncbi:MAG TPA: tetratricopeptide repeat protein [Polyangiaceae bacterium]|nr:tetratricopeptide repeat protein [Polyangiaceae bacterium]
MTSEKDDDAALRALYAAAKRERPSAGARERAFERALGSGRAGGRRRNGVVVAALAVAAGVALTAGLSAVRRGPVSVGPEPVPVRLTRANPSPDLPRAASAAARVSPPASSAEPSAAHVEKAAAPAPAPTLGDEIAQLQAVRTALGAGDPKRALALLDRYARSTRGGSLGDEALVLRLDALTRAGRGAEASALASRFVANNPGSPLVDRARAFVGVPKPAASTAPSPTPAEKTE